GLSQKLVALSEAYGDLGQHEQALASLAEAHAFCEASGEFYWAAEVARLRGAILLQQAAGRSPTSGRPSSGTAGAKRRAQGSATAEAEACLGEALGIAQQQHAKGGELRAAIGLARLWRGQGKSRDAHELLSGVLGWFTEGFETADVREAQALVAELT